MISASQKSGVRNHPKRRRGAKVGLHRVGLLTPNRKLELRRHSTQSSHVILRSLSADEGSPQFAGNIPESTDGLAIQTNCRDSSSQQVGTRMTMSA